MVPTLDELLDQIAAVSGAAAVDADVPLTQLSDVDSMDLMEWLYSFQSEHPEVGADAALFADDDGRTTLRVVHERLTAGAVAPA
ncbi:hypothetical protein MO973_40935 [Paenibacillus sp. TRM 82003]|uniref:hypothetical protein n=1 Tax=unclassified Kineococcus TaxID=2621656 RepID=UPI001F58CF01|nr:hypothetical protein [Kineococcus sp. TRM81007]MCI2237332.1 hypothetical protein [Kineococcus sp. TRM81007]MCI3926561.1 hypothetical protein [Paenibacillus sp. TRM 82003]